MTQTPTITQMLPYSMRSEFFSRIMKGARYRVRSGLGDFLVRLKQRLDSRREAARLTGKDCDGLTCDETNCVCISHE